MNEQDALELATRFYDIARSSPEGRKSQVVSIIQIAIYDARRYGAYPAISGFDDRLMQAQATEPPSMVEGFNAVEAALLAKLNALKPKRTVRAGEHGEAIEGPPEPTAFDQRWLAIARTDIERGFMALRRAITGE